MILFREPELLMAGINRNKITKCKHSKAAPTCKECRVTLSKGICLNRMCNEFNKQQGY